MLRSLLTPRWITAALVVAVVAGVFVGLGRWQLSRHDERALENEVRTARLAADPVELTTLLDAVGSDVESLEYRRAVAVGRFRPDQEFLLRSRVRAGQAGYHVVTPFELEDRSATILIDRGWVPLSYDEVPVTAAPPPGGRVEVRGVLRTSEARGRFGPEDPPGPIASRVDITWFSAQVGGDLAPVWMLHVDEDDETFPLAAAEPVFDDSGPHLVYAIQWFSFAVIALVGFLLLVRRQVVRR